MMELTFEVIVNIVVKEENAHYNEIEKKKKAYLKNGSKGYSLIYLKKIRKVLFIN